MNSKAPAAAHAAPREKFLVLPVIILILAQMGATGDNGALSLAATALTQNLGAFMAGVGAGTVSAHASNVVALAVNERDASQSGGIQSTMRNVGQAMGVALLGAVLIFGITSTVDAGMARSSTITPEVRQQVSSLTIDLGSNKAFEDEIKSISMTDAERKELVDMEAQARFDSVRTAYAVGAVIVLLGLLTTPAIKTFSKDKKAAGGTVAPVTKAAAARTAKK